MNKKIYLKQCEIFNKLCDQLNNTNDTDCHKDFGNNFNNIAWKYSVIKNECYYLSNFLNKS